MGVGNWLPNREHRLFYVDIDSWLDEGEFSSLVQSGEIEACTRYEDFLQESYDSELEMITSALESTAGLLRQNGIPVESFHYAERSEMNAIERAEWMYPLLECGWVRVAVKEIEISKLSVVTYPLQHQDDDSDLANLPRAEFVTEHGVTPERCVTATSLQMNALDQLLVAVIEAEISAVSAKTVTRRGCAWTSRLVDESMPVKTALSKFRNTYRYGLSRRHQKQAA